MGLPSAARDRTCLVTGASSGIGAELARELARRGQGVTLTARRKDRLEDLAAELSDTHGVRAEVAAVDLADAEARLALADEIAGRGLTVEMLVNNAGVGTFGPVHDGDATREVTMLRTNVEALAHLCSLFLPGMVERKRGAVLNVASTAAFQPMPGQAGYGASKAFVLSYSHALRAETRGTGVTVTTLCPGPVETEFNRAAGLDEEAATNALPRFMWVKAEDVARLAVDGLDRGRAVVVPGMSNRLGTVAGRHSPAGLVARLVARRHPAL
jgi:hypothetical protein